MFGLGARDVGRRLQDLELSYRPIELRSRIDEAHQQQQPVVLRGVERVPSTAACSTSTST